jgi:hypothetical protein
MLVDFEGTQDPHYPEKLAARVLRLLEDPTRLNRQQRQIGLARTKFDYAILASKLAEVIDEVANGGAQRAACRAGQ